MAITVAVERLLELRPIRLQMHKKLRQHPGEFAALAHRNRRWLRTCHRGRKECGERASCCELYTYECVFTSDTFACMLVIWLF